MLKCKITAMADTAWPLIHANVPLRIVGPTGVGKSAIIKHDLMPKIEKEFGPSVLHDIRLSTKDIVDGTGMPVIDKEARATFWTRPAFIPADDGKMHVMFFDEFGHANPQLQQMAYSIVLDRALGGYSLPKNNRIILASNTREDGGGDNKMLKPLENRMGHMQVEPDEPGFIEKTKEWGWNRYLIAFLTTRPGEAYRVDPNNCAFPTPRSLDMLNNALASVFTILGPIQEDDKNNPKRLTMIEQATTMIVGEGFSRAFTSFVKNLMAKLPKMSEILQDPENARIPADPHMQYTVAAAIGKNMRANNADKFAAYLARLSPDVASMAVHDALSRESSLENNKSLKKLLLDK